VGRNDRRADLCARFELPRDRRALGVNALDEVPDSTWFTNRIGVRELTPRRGPQRPADRRPRAPQAVTIHSTKTEAPRPV